MEHFKLVSKYQPTGDQPQAIEALVTLGYTQGEVAPIVAKLDPSLSASELIRRTLQEFGKKRS